MIRRPPRSTRTDTLFPYTTLFRSCTAISRVIVLNSLHDDLTEALVQAIKKIKVGPAWDPEATMGPLITDEHRVSVLRTLAAGLSDGGRSEEHTSELQSLMRISYAVFCLQKKKIK